jgi:hypothetical protein
LIAADDRRLFGVAPGGITQYPTEIYGLPRVLGGSVVSSNNFFNGWHDFFSEVNAGQALDWPLTEQIHKPHKLGKNVEIEGPHHG